MGSENNKGRSPRGRPVSVGNMYSVDRKVVPHPDEVRMLNFAYYLRERDMSLRQIVTELNRRGYCNRRGNPITLNNVWWYFNKGVDDERN